MSTLVAQTISNGTVSTSSANVIQGSAKAWVTFTGSTGAIRASYNTSSITYVTTGVWMMNFTNAMTDVNYCRVATAGFGGADDGSTAPIVFFDSYGNRSVGYTAPTTSSFKIICAGFNLYNPNTMCVSVFR
jgi:hypothetical protein